MATTQSNPLAGLIKPAPGVATQPAAPAAQPAPSDPQAAADSGAPDDGASDSDADDTADDATADAGDDTPVKVQKEFSNIGHALTDLADNLGIKRSFTVPYVEQDMHEHIEAVGAAAAEAGGLTRNLLFTFHTKGKRGWGTPDGATVGFNATKLREAIIPADFEQAKIALADTKTLVNEYAKLLGNDDPVVKTAQSQLNVIGKHNGQGMTALDFSLALLSLPGPLLQAVARAAAHKRHGEHRIALSSPIQEQQAQQPQQ